MQTLIIGSENLQREIGPALETDSQILWVPGLVKAFEKLESADIDLIVFDTRNPGFDAATELRALIFGLPVTTRILAIVEHLPTDDLFAESGVVYLTPPVNLGDIHWFIRCQTACPHV